MKTFFWLLIIITTTLASCEYETFPTAPLPPPPNPNIDILFSTAIYPIFAANSCTGCHGSAGGLTLSGNSSAVIASLKSSTTPAVTPNNSDGSPFYTKFKNNGVHNGKTLTPVVVQDIKGWIDQGAKDN